ncbi:MAG TPA: DNA-3-methyladenine glycosylase 2 family protein [Candidatus Limnocylindria bacterium]|nr:DNA-3-methyladenine glycosylase 2 family protein [Candidatus Limnocylindria bacterium]
MAFDLVRTLAPLRHGQRDPTIRFGRREVLLGIRTPGGPATLRLLHVGGELFAEAWGVGAEAAIGHAARLAGLDDRPERLIPRHPVVAELARTFPGVRLPWSGRPFDALVPAILEQKVTGSEAFLAWRRLVLRYGEPAPGHPGLMLPPEPRLLAALPYHAFHPLGIERRRAEAIRRVAGLAERLLGADADGAARMLRLVPGIGPWTLAEVRRVAFGDADAVSVGDYHIPHLVSWLLAGEPRGSDARMFELLEPYRGQRGRVQRLFELSGRFPPRRGPRMAPRDIASI